MFYIWQPNAAIKITAQLSQIVARMVYKTLYVKATPYLTLLWGVVQQILLHNEWAEIV